MEKLEIKVVITTQPYLDKISKDWLHYSTDRLKSAVFFISFLLNLMIFLFVKVRINDDI